MRRKGMSGRARPDEPLADFCEIQTTFCTGRATQRHHILRRSQGGSDDRENTLDTCSSCHDYVHANPKISYAQGWLRRSGVA
jgi:hypothetical protein